MTNLLFMKAHAGITFIASTNMADNRTRNRVTLLGKQKCCSEIN